MKKMIVIVRLLYWSALVIAFLAITWWFNAIMKPLLIHQLEERMKARSLQATPGVREYYWVEEHGALHLQDLGQGVVHIGFAGIDGNGRWIYSPEKDGRAWFQMWSTRTEPDGTLDIAEDAIAKLHIGDEVVFGGYRIKLVEIRLGGGQLGWACLEVQTTTESDSP